MAVMGNWNGMGTVTTPAGKRWGGSKTMGSVPWKHSRAKVYFAISDSETASGLADAVNCICITPW